MLGLPLHCSEFYICLQSIAGEFPRLWGFVYAHMGLVGHSFIRMALTSLVS